MAAPGADTAALRAAWAAHFQLLDTSSAAEREEELKACSSTPIIRSGSGAAGAAAAASVPSAEGGGGSLFPAVQSANTLKRLFPFCRDDRFLGRQRGAERLLQVRHVLTGPRGFAALRPGGRSAAAYPEVQQLVAFAAQRALNDTAARHFDKDKKEWSVSFESARSRLISCLSPQLTATLLADVCKGLLCPSEPPPPDTPEHMAAFILVLRSAVHLLGNEIPPETAYSHAVCHPISCARNCPGIVEMAENSVLVSPLEALDTALPLIRRFSETMNTPWASALKLIDAALAAQDKNGGTSGPHGSSGDLLGVLGGMPGDGGLEEVLAEIEGHQGFAALAGAEAELLAAAGVAAWRSRQPAGSSDGDSGGSSSDGRGSGGDAAKDKQREADAQRGAKAIAGRLMRLLTRARAALLLHILRASRLLWDRRSPRKPQEDDRSAELAPAQTAVLLHLLRAVTAAVQTRVAAAAAAAVAAAGGEGQERASDEEAAAERAIEELVARFCTALDHFKAHIAAATPPPGANGAAAAGSATARDLNLGSLPRRLRVQLGAAALACGVFGNPPTIFDPLHVSFPRLASLKQYVPLLEKLSKQWHKAFSERVIGALSGAMSQPAAPNEPSLGLQYITAEPLLMLWFRKVHVGRATHLYCALMRESKSRARDPAETERDEQLIGGNDIPRDVVRWAAGEGLADGSEYIPGLPSPPQIRQAPAPEAAARAGGGVAGALPGDGVPGCAAGCPWCKADERWDDEWAARQARSQQQQQQQQQQQDKEGAADPGSVYGDWPVDPASPFMWRRLMWQLLGRLAPHARDMFRTQAGMCPHSADASLWQDLMVCLERSIVFADPRVAALAGVAQNRAPGQQVIVDSAILGYARALNAAFEEAFHPAMVVSAARTIEALSPGLEALPPSPEAIPLAPASVAPATTRALERAFGPEGLGPGGGRRAPQASEEGYSGDAKEGWEMWPVYYHMHMLGLMGHEAEAVGAVRRGSLGQAAAARERAVLLWQRSGTTEGRRSSSGGSSSSDEEGSRLVHVVQAVYSDPDARLAAVRFALRQALLPSDFEALQQQGSYYWLQTHPAHWRTTVTPLAAPWTTCERCGQQPSRGKPLLVCGDCGGGRFCSPACRDAACAAPYDKDDRATHALFCSVFERGASDARSRFEAAAARWRSRGVGESPWERFFGGGGGGAPPPPPARDSGTTSTATTGDRRVGRGPAAASAAAASAALALGAWPEACIGLEEGAVPTKGRPPITLVIQG